MGQAVTTVTRHRKRAEIEAALAKGAPVRRIAARFGLSKSAAHRHKERMALEMAAAPSAKDTTAEELLGKLGSLQGEAEGILAKAKRDGNHRAALGAIKESRSIIELLARMLGELQTGTTVNITVSNQRIALRADLMMALAPYPEARVAVMHALEDHKQPGE